MATGFRSVAGIAVIAIVAGCQTGALPSPSAPSQSATSPTHAPSTVPATPAPTQGLPLGAEPVTLDPADFVAGVDHPFWPMRPGSRWVYSETDLDGSVLRVEVTVLPETRTILGITATVVHDIVTEDGAVVEDTIDWYAQDRAGNLWYLGEKTAEYEAGVVTSTAGSWEAGVGGAQPGVILPGSITVGTTYRQEYLAGEAEDAGAIVSLDEWVEVAAGRYAGVLLTRDYTALHPEILEHKFYAPGVGPILILGISGGTSREALISLEPGP